MKPVVFIPDPIAQCGLTLLQAECECLAPWMNGTATNSPGLTETLRRADAVIVRLFSIRSAEIAAAPRLKVIAKHGVGVDNIDIASATQRRIPVVYTPAANAKAVAEHTIALMLACAREGVYMRPLGAKTLRSPRSLRFNPLLVAATLRQVIRGSFGHLLAV